MSESPPERGYVVPVWVRMGQAWVAGWADAGGAHAVTEGWPTLPFSAWCRCRPRDPNRADFGDRPDLSQT